VHYYLDRDAFSKGILAGLIDYSGVDSQYIGTEHFRLTGDPRARRRIDNLIEWQRRIIEQEVEANANVSAQELAIKFGLTGTVATATAGAFAPVASGLFSTTVVGFTETTVMGNVAAASLTGGVSLGVGEAFSTAALGGETEEILYAGALGFDIGAVLGAPAGLAAPVGWSPTLAYKLPSGGGVLRRGGAGPARAGAAAEERVARSIGLPRNVGPGRVTIPSATGAVKYRVPDFGPQATVEKFGAIIEVKDVTRLSYSKQLQDLVAEARAQGAILRIYTNAPAPTKGELFGILQAQELGRAEKVVEIIPIP
jgi:hypothetical protein